MRARRKQNFASPASPHLCPTLKPWASPGWKVFIFDVAVAPGWLNQKGLGWQNGWKAVLGGLSLAVAYWEAYRLDSDYLLSWWFGGWVGFEGEHGGGNIVHPRQLSHWSWYFMKGGGPPLNKQPLFNPPGQPVPSGKSICRQPHAQHWVFVPLT